MNRNPNPFFDKAPTLLQHEKLVPQNKKELAGFNPYQFNAGNVAAIVGNGFVVVAGDTRLSVGYNIMSRNTSKIFKLTDTAVLISSGMYADFLALTKYLKARIAMYKFDNDREPGVESLAQLLSNTLYGRRFFPYYCFNILAGVNEKGEAFAYDYDAVGSYQKVDYSSQGSANQLITPSLDYLMQGYNKMKHRPLETKEEIVETIVDVFTSTAERDIYCGDTVEVCVIEKGGVQEIKSYALRHD